MGAVISGTFMEIPTAEVYRLRLDVESMAGSCEWEEGEKDVVWSLLQIASGDI